MKNRVVIAIQDMSSGGSYMMATDLSPIINYFKCVGVVEDDNFFTRAIGRSAPYVQIVSSVSKELLFLYPTDGVIYKETGLNWAFIGSGGREDMENLLQVLDYEILKLIVSTHGLSITEAVKKMKPYLEG